MRDIMLVKRKSVYAVCPNCGFNVEIRHHAAAHCEIHRRVGELCGTGISDAQVGRSLGISRERVRQILLKAGPEKGAEIIAKRVVTQAHKLGKEVSLQRVIEVLKSVK
jgi:hypothetical protein